MIKPIIIFAHLCSCRGLLLVYTVYIVNGNDFVPTASFHLSWTHLFTSHFAAGIPLNNPFDGGAYGLFT